MLGRPVRGGRDLEKELGGWAGEDEAWGGGWSHLGPPSQAQPNRCSGGAGESAPGDCGVSGPDTKSIAARARGGGGGPGSPS